LVLDSIYRRTLLGLAGSPPIERFLRERGMQLGVGRFVAGESPQQAVGVAEELERSGLLVILDLLGEFVDNRDGVEAMTREIVAGLEPMSRSLSSPAMSVKPTQLGLGIDFELALSNARAIAERARSLGAVLCLDMENHPYVDATLRLYSTLHEEGFLNVSTVLQSYLRRSSDDLEELLRLEPRPTLRIVKGAYREPAEVAFQDKAKVDGQFRHMVFRLLEAGGKANIATHDERLLREVAAFLLGAGLSSGSYEFQLLYGVKPALQRRMMESGHPVRVYVPYGRDWYGYFSRRLAERPANLAFVLRGLFG
jgi:proline dehydrogenase